MLVKRVPFKLELSSMEDHERSEGLHVSDVIRDLAVKSGILDRKWVEQDMDPTTLALGLAWEEWIVKQHPEILFHPGEVSKDGITMSPDGICVLGGDIGTTGLGGIEDSDHYYRVHEFKYTRKSNRDFIEALRRQDKKVWMWLTQIKSYCYAVETGVAMLHTLFANGDYSKFGGDESRAQYEIYSLAFKQSELKENWSMITRHAERMQLR